MSTPQHRTTSAPARQAALCMCAIGSACTSFAPGHAVHMIQARLVAATPSEWRDALVTSVDADGGTVVITSIDDDTSIELWNGAGAALALEVGSPVGFHPRYHVLSGGSRKYNALTLS